MIPGRDYKKCKGKGRNLLAVLGEQTGLLRIWVGLEHPGWERQGKGERQCWPDHAEICRLLWGLCLFSECDSKGGFQA